MNKPLRVDPIAHLSRFQRLKWRRRERQILKQFQREQTSSLKLIQGRRVVGMVMQRHDFLVAVIEGCWLKISGITEESRCAVVEIANLGCYVDEVGRYGASWWIALRSDPDAPGRLTRVVVMASHLGVIEGTIQGTW